MKPSPELITALRRAADRIEDPNGGYCWGNTAKCNCGMVAVELLGLTEQQADALTRSFGSWSSVFGQCERTGMPMPEIVSTLMCSGLTRDNITEIENLSNEQVRRRAGLALWWNTHYWVTDSIYYGDCEKPDSAVRYLRAQADILEEQLAPKPTSPAAAKECVHMWLETTQTCLYCCATKPAQPVGVV